MSKQPILGCSWRLLFFLVTIATLRPDSQQIMSTNVTGCNSMFMHNISVFFRNMTLTGMLLLFWTCVHVSKWAGNAIHAKFTTSKKQLWSASGDTFPCSVHRKPAATCYQSLFAMADEMPPERSQEELETRHEQVSFLHIGISTSNQKRAKKMIFAIFQCLKRKQEVCIIWVVSTEIWRFSFEVDVCINLPRY